MTARPAWAATARWLLFFLLLANVIGIASLPICDQEFSWDLRPGECILERRAFPGESLFAMAPQHTPPATQLFTMTSCGMA